MEITEKVYYTDPDMVEFKSTLDGQIYRCYYVGTNWSVFLFDAVQSARQTDDNIFIKILTLQLPKDASAMELDSAIDSHRRDEVL